MHPGQSQHSSMAKSAIMSSASSPALLDLHQNRNKSHNHRPAPPQTTTTQKNQKDQTKGDKPSTLMSPTKTVVGRALGSDLPQHENNKSLKQPSEQGVGHALTDTPVSTAPSSPQMYVYLSIYHSISRSLYPCLLFHVLPAPLFTPFMLVSPMF
jgi:6-phosphofructo-2-kinase